MDERTIAEKQTVSTLLFEALMLAAFIFKNIGHALIKRHETT